MWKNLLYPKIIQKGESYRIISAYSLSFPLLSLHLRYITEASTLAGEKVLGSFNNDMTLSRMVLKHPGTTHHGYHKALQNFTKDLHMTRFQNPTADSAHELVKMSVKVDRILRFLGGQKKKKQSDLKPLRKIV